MHLLRPPTSTCFHLCPPTSTCVHICPPASIYVHLHPPVSTCIQLRPAVSTSVCDSTQQNVKRYRYFFPLPNISDIDTGTFFGTKFYQYDSETFFRYQIIAIPDPKPPAKMKNSWYRYLYQYKSSKFQNFGNKNQLLYQILPIPAPRLFSRTKFFQYRFRDFFRYQFFGYRF